MSGAPFSRRQEHGRRVLRPHLDWLLGAVTVLLLAVVLFGSADAAPLRFAVTIPAGTLLTRPDAEPVLLPAGGAVLVCGLAYHLAGEQTRLVELQPCPQVFGDGFEAAP